MLWGVRGACVRGNKSSIARSALLSGYLGKSGHLPSIILFPYLLYPGKELAMTVSIFMIVAIALERYNIDDGRLNNM